MSSQIDPNVLSAHLEEARASAKFYQQRCVDLNLTIRQVTKQLQEAQEQLAALAAELTSPEDGDVEESAEEPVAPKHSPKSRKS